MNCLPLDSWAIWVYDIQTTSGAHLQSVVPMAGAGVGGFNQGRMPPQTPPLGAQVCLAIGCLKAKYEQIHGTDTTYFGSEPNEGRME